MRSKLTLFAAVCVAAAALSTPASAATILAFSQNTSSDAVVATVSGSTTTLTTNGSTSTSIPITITQLGTIQMTSVAAFETFNPALTSSAPTTAGQQVGFTGTILITTGPGGTGNNFLTAAVVNGRLVANGAAGGFDAASNTTNGGNPTTVTLTSANSAVIAAMGGTTSPFTTSGAVSLSLVNITPSQSGAGFTSFTAQNQGSVSSITPTGGVPEPASVISVSTAILAGLGCFGWSRRKSSKA